MDPSKKTTEALLNEVTRLERQLFKRYQTIIDLASVSSSEPTSSSARSRANAATAQNAIAERNQAAYNALRMEMETAAMVKTCEDLASLSRQLKELWLFGRLDTLRGKGDGAGEEGERVEEDARAVGELVRRLVNGSEGAESA